ncbi:MAG: AsmA family protein [Flavobacterium sp.]|nr:AsmA family protein [Flavobacterium sp.]
MFKKILKIVGIFFVVLIVAAFAIPYFFKDQIKAKIVQTINNNLDAKVAFADADLSLFKSFPQANVSITKLSVINKAPFLGDTLVSFDELNLKMSIKELFKGKEESMNVEAVSSKNGLVNIIFNKEGIGNYDIALKNKDKIDTKSQPLALKIKEYSVENFKFKFTNEASKMKLVIDSINHSGTGDFANDVLDLNTKTTAKMSLDMDKTNYMKNIAISLNAVLGLDLKNSKYTFKQNQAKINELPLQFDGFIQLVDAGQQYDLTFKTPTSSFKNFLGLIPSAYSSKLDNVKTTGDFSVSGFAKGVYSDTSVPKFNVAIASNNASFQYPNLPKSVQNIIVDTKIINDTGILNDTYVNLDKLSFSIDKDVFNAKANIKNIVENPLIDASLKGTINLSNLTKAYPIKLDKPLTGILKADVTSKFDMKAVENNQYNQINNAGTMSLSGFQYADENGKKMIISTAMVVFNPSRVDLQEFKATTGKTDLNVTGVLENFYGFLFKKQELKGNFNLNSNQIAVSDFVTTSAPTKNAPKKTEAMKIPSFLNCSLTAKANTVIYNNLVLKDVSGKLIVKDQKVTMQNVKTSIFGGQIGLNGDVSTKEKTPKFNMNLSLNQVNIAETFTKLDMMKKIIPLAGIINGKLNSTIKLSGNLDAVEMTPDLKSISGDLLGQLLSTTLNTTNSTLLTALTSNIKFIDLSKLNLNDLKGALSFDNGKVVVKPFDIKYKDIKINVAGTHGFDQIMNYNLKLDVPAKYLGTQANTLFAKLSESDVNKLDNIPLNITIGGNFSNPRITTDLKQATTALVTSLVKMQKEKLIGKGKSALEDLLNKNSSASDTTKTKTINTARDLLNGLFGKKKKDPTTNP